MDNSKDWGEFLEGIKAAQQAAEAQKEANEQHEKYERLRFEFTLALINNNDLLHERSFKEICQLGVELTDEFMKHEADSEDEAWEKAYDTVDLGDLEVRDCEYSDDEITLLEE